MRQWSPEKAALSSMAQWRHESASMSAPVEYSMLAQCHWSTWSPENGASCASHCGLRERYLRLQLGCESSLALNEAHEHIAERIILLLSELLVRDLSQGDSARA